MKKWQNLIKGILGIMKIHWGKMDSLGMGDWLGNERLILNPRESIFHSSFSNWVNPTIPIPASVLQCTRCQWFWFPNPECIHAINIILITYKYLAYDLYVLFRSNESIKLRRHLPYIMGKIEDALIFL